MKRRWIALRLAELTQDLSERHGGRVVKMLGDGVHFIFDEPADAVLGSLDFVESAERRGLPPARIGINAGPITYTDGDYYGLAVIIAARIASIAGPGEVLVARVSCRRPALGKTSGSRRSGQLNSRVSLVRN
jgi:adenylate cyclase